MKRAPSFPFDILGWYEWFWIIYVCVASFLLYMYLMILFLEGNTRKRSLLIVIGLLQVIVTIMVAQLPIQLFSGHAKMTMYIQESREYFH